MLNIKLTGIKGRNLREFLSHPKTLLYADFNVLNYLYEEKIQLPENIIAYPDSLAVYLGIKYLTKNPISKFVSTDFQDELLIFLINSNCKVFFFGDHKSVLDKLVVGLEYKYPGIIISGIHDGYIYETNNVIELINRSNADILFVGLGVRHQEKWIIENFNSLNCKLIISVGGWFQYLAHSKKRAPKFLRDLHLEWIHKLVMEFGRVWTRYFFGVPLFFYRIITKKIIIDYDGD
ncbi:MAG: WecB/TagA/CpsF family glycosyltransferase [Ignavibacteria bacterium]|nr:WecB/TagA/CpsF family glycosyltransferase [Ignavibacteria bacterium]